MFYDLNQHLIYNKEYSGLFCTRSAKCLVIGSTAQTDVYLGVDLVAMCLKPGCLSGKQVAGVDDAFLEST